LVRKLANCWRRCFALFSRRSGGSTDFTSTTNTHVPHVKTGRRLVGRTKRGTSTISITSSNLVEASPLHGPVQETASIEEAINLVEQYQEAKSVKGFVRYELIARYSNGDHITGDFGSKQSAISFLNNLR